MNSRALPTQSAPSRPDTLLGDPPWRIPQRRLLQPTVLGAAENAHPRLHHPTPPVSTASQVQESSPAGLPARSGVFTLGLDVEQERHNDKYKSYRLHPRCRTTNPSRFGGHAAAAEPFSVLPWLFTQATLHFPPVLAPAVQPQWQQMSDFWLDRHGFCRHVLIIGQHRHLGLINSLYYGTQPMSAQPGAQPCTFRLAMCYGLWAM